MASDSAVVLYSRAGCSYCTRAKALLTARGISFGIVDVALEPGRRQEAEDISNAKTVPQIFVGRRYLGGFQELQGLDEQGKLQAALKHQPDDGAPFAPTAAEALSKSVALPAGVEEALAPRAEEMKQLKYEAGSRPSFRAFMRYAVKGKPVQDQSTNVPLNLAAMPGAPAPPPALPQLGVSGLGALLRQAMLRLLDGFVDASTGDVDYVAMRDSQQFALFRAVAAELGHERLREELLTMPEAERKAFLINLYNAMTFHGVVAYGRRSGLWYLYCFYLTPAVSYRLAGVPVSLDDVENGMLRTQPGYFEAESQELQHQLRMSSLDARIHMALNCGARGCPAVAVYEAATLDAELDSAAAAFVAVDRNVRVDFGEGSTPLPCADRRDGSSSSVRIACTELFKMYLEDFAGPGAKAGNSDSIVKLVRWILPHARGDKREALAAVAAPGAPAPRLEWMAYNWETNGSNVELDKRVYRLTW